MSSRSRLLLALGAALISNSASAQVDGLYFGRIDRISEGAPVVHRGNGAVDLASANLPIGPGDVIITGANERLEIVFDTGSILRVDASSVVRVESIAARSISEPVSVTALYLDSGAVRVDYRRRDRRELFQVLSDHAAVRLDDGATAEIAADDETNVHVFTGTARVRRASSTDASDEYDDIKLSSDRRLAIDARGARYEASIERAGPTALTKWSLKRAQSRSQRSAGPLPDGLTSLPKVVEDFVRHDSYRYGEWLADSVYGTVWRPYANDAYPLGQWQPFLYGSWSPLVGEAFWVPLEPWGWTPYHFGLWTWDARYGWLWIPGGEFTPARVVWDRDASRLGWRPVTLWDWYTVSATLPAPERCLGLSYYFRTCRQPEPRLAKIRRDTAVADDAPRAARQAIEQAAKGNEALQRSATEARDHFVVVGKRDIDRARIHEHRIDRDGDRVSPPRNGVLRTYAARAESSGTVRHDWNPDVGKARALGGTVRYSSEENRIVGPELERAVVALETARSRGVSATKSYSSGSASTVGAGAIRGTRNVSTTSRESRSERGGKKKN